MKRLENTREFRSSGAVCDNECPDEIAAQDLNDPVGHASDTHLEDPGRFSDGLLRIESRGKYGFVDKAGKIVIPCKFGVALPFKEGLAPASIDPSGDSGRSAEPYGYIDKTGKFVIPPQFESASRFSEGLAFVRDRKGIGGFIDHTGKVVIPVPSGFASDFHDGAAAVGETI